MVRAGRNCQSGGRKVDSCTDESFHPTTHMRSSVLLLAAFALAPSSSAAQSAVTTDDMRSFRPRQIGPAVTGGRIHDVEAYPHDPSTIFVATASGGLWKSTNRGISWTNVFDTMAVSTFGDVALAPSDPAIIYAGTGEQQNRQSSSYGNGVYRSDDGGESWRHLGLVETRHIGRVRVHPTDPDVAYVAALGNLWKESEERGVYRTTDGGESWDHVLAIDAWTGAVDLVINPDDPDELYAAAYQRMRKPWGFNGGGPGGGIYKTADGGDSWTRLTGGLPTGDLGRIGIAISQSNPLVLNALVEHAANEIQGTYRTENGGMTWERVNELNIRPMYYSHVFIDPNDEDRVFTLATRSYVSDDGGRSFRQIAVAPTYDVGVHADHHSLWIDPNDPEHLYLAGDAGMHESYDGGATFRKMNNFPIAQFYAIGVDMRDPYWVYGGLQDNHSFMGPSRTRRWIGIVNDDWMQNGFGDGMYWQVDPSDARFAYGSSNGGNYFRYDTETGDMLDITPPDPLGERHRFDWTSPLMVSAHDPSTVYVAGNRFFTSRDRGSSWAMTEDLSRRVDRDTIEIMGVVGSEISLSRNDGTGSFGEAVTLDESPLDPAVLWVGFDDGNLQVSRDGGASWTEVSGNVSGIADGTYVSRIAASSAGRGTAHAAFDAHRDGDFAPYLFRTTDYGATWEPLHATLPRTGVVNVVVEHPDNPDLLFAGTEHAVFVSTDAGANWARMPNLPTTHYDDMVIHPRDKDLVLGTHGRSILILDDTRPLAEWAAADAVAVAVFSAGPGTIRLYRKDTSYRAQAEFAGENPVDGVPVTYRLANSASEARLTVSRRASGEVVREMLVPSEGGTHRVNWDLRHGMSVSRWEPHEDPQLPRSIAARGPWVSPGDYVLTVSADGVNASTPLTVLGDPDMPMITQAMYDSRERFMLDALALQGEAREVLRARGGAPAGGFGFGAAGDVTTPEGRLRAALGSLSRAYGSLNGSAVRSGSLFPPTETHRDAMKLVRAALIEVRQSG